jgi:UDP-N-acetylmuramoyl-tripeptide--D-alanyl-D-alanine ligase
MITVELINSILGEPSHYGILPESFAQFSMDTRTLKKDELFFAVKGEQRDGHDFLNQVADTAHGAVVSHTNPELNLTQWCVDDVTKAMGDLARALRKQNLQIPLVGITGSCGKTTCTQLLAHICQQAGSTLSNEKSFNNKWGVPLTLSRIAADNAFIIQEIGTNSPHEIDYLTHIAQPDVALITIIAPVHLDGLGSLDGVAEEKSDIYHGLSANGIAVINADDPYKDFLMAKLSRSQRILDFSLNDPSAHISLAGEPVYTATHSEFTLKIGSNAYQVQWPLLGIHNIANALAVIACALALNIEESIIIDGLNTAKPPEQRLVRFYSDKGYTVLDDSYNANPLAMKMAFHTLAREEGRQIAVLGDMAECGEQADEVHRQLAHDLREAGISTVYSTGMWMRALHDEASSIGLTSEYFKEKPDLTTFLQKDLKAGDCVLIKGSNSSGMKEVVDAII